MPRPKLPEGKRKVVMPITVDQAVADAARDSGNASEFMNEAAKRYMAYLERSGGSRKRRR